MDVLKGKALVVGDGVSSDEILHARYALLTEEEMANHVFEDLGPQITSKVEDSDIVIAGKNFGCGSGRESSARSVRAAGFKAIIAESFARMYYRNAINQGIYAIECAGISKLFSQGDIVELLIDEGKVRGEKGELTFNALPKIVKSIIDAGGVIEHGKQINCE